MAALVTPNIELSRPGVNQGWWGTSAEKEEEEPDQFKPQAWFANDYEDCFLGIQ